MRNLSVLSLLLLTSCIPRTEPPAPPPPAQNDAALRQCLADLNTQRVAYKRLPDRRYQGGCSALGAVQLLDIGTPVANLGAMTCDLARAFTGWARGSVQPAARRWFGVGVRRIESFGTYSCRPVNSRAGARLSEHGRSNAVDIAAFVLADGRRIAVVDGWKGEDESVRGFLRELHQQGCRRFNIVIGPDGDAYHYNHLHFDMGRGPYCR